MTSRLVTVITRRYGLQHGAGTRQEMTMGLLDVLNGMQNGPRGPSNPSAQSSGGMSPMTMAILALLAYKAVKHLTGSQSGASPAPAPSPGGGGMAGGPGGGGLGGSLGDVLKGGLGGLLAGGAAGSVISGGLGDLLKQFQQSGHGETANSWVSEGPNKQISPGDLAKRARRRSDQQSDVAKRPVAPGTARRPQPASARGDRPFDAGRTAADRKRIGGPALRGRSASVF